MAKKQYTMTPGSIFWYYAVNIFTFGSLYFMKIAAKKALSESRD